jgi:hypothetical protein
MGMGAWMHANASRAPHLGIPFISCLALASPCFQFNPLPRLFPVIAPYFDT